MTAPDESRAADAFRPDVEAPGGLGGEQPSPVFCARHPRVETYLRCGRCELPICPRCLVITPVGARCRDCARLRKLPVFDVRPVHLLRGLAGGVGAGVLGALAMAFLPGLGFLSLLLMLALGYAVGESASAATNRKRGTLLGIVAALAVPLGLVAGRTILLLVFAGGVGGDVGAAALVATRTLVAGSWGILGLLAAMGVAFSRVR